MNRNRPDIETFSELLEPVYESAADPDQWEVFLQGLAATLNAKSGLFRVVDERVPALKAGVEYNLDPDLQDAYRRYYVSQDPVVQALKDCPGVFIAPGQAFLDQKRLEHTEFFNDYALPQDNVYLCGGLAMRSEEFTIKFGVQRDRRTGPFCEEDASFIRRFVPHIQRAVRLGHMLGLAQQEAMTAERALDSLALGVLLLDEEDRILQANSRAEDILRHRRGLSRAGGHLGTARHVDGDLLREALRTVKSRARIAAAPVPETLMLTPEPDQPQLLVIVCPVSPVRPEFRGPWPEAVAAVFISNLASAGLLNEDILVALYGLTAAEARLACALSRGASISDLEIEWDVSRETLRTHLKRVLHKTGTGRQSELVRLLAGSPWQIADSGEA